MAAEVTEQQHLEQRHVGDLKPQAQPPAPVPDHPPYAEMVRVALCALAEPGGSSERSISDYIVSSITGLPPGHDKLLPFYLRRLVSSRYLCEPSPGRYLLSPEPTPESIPLHRRWRPSSSTLGRGRPRKQLLPGRLPPVFMQSAVEEELPSSAHAGASKQDNEMDQQQQPEKGDEPQASSVAVAVAVAVSQRKDKKKASRKKKTQTKKHRKLWFQS